MNADHLVNATFTGNGPPPPTGLSVGSATTSSLFISWNASVGATSYQLFRNASQVFSGSGTSYTDTGLASGTTYQYAVRATNSFGSSALSSAVSGTTLAATQICFWSNDGTDGTLTVYVDGIAVGNLTQYFLYPVVPSWGAAGTLVVTVQPGSHRLTAQSQSGALSWDSSVTLTQGEQLKFQLTVTQWCFWTKRSDVGAWINIDIDSYLVGSLTHFFAAQPSWCASGALVVTTSPGSHTLYAYSQGGTYWGPASLSLTSGQQQFFELK
jgi:hypothetical protein